MSHEKARQLIEQATQAIQAGQFQSATELLGQAIALNSTDTEAFVLQGVACSHLSRTDEATEAFRTAIELAPHNAKAFYNFAVHLHGVGKAQSALEMAREAVRVDPNHASAWELLNRLETELKVPPISIPPLQPKGPVQVVQVEQAGGAFAAPPEGSGYYRAGYYDYQTPIHSLAFIESWGKSWDISGWLLVLLNAASFVYGLLYLFEFPKRLADLNNNVVNPAFGSLGGTLILDVVFFFLECLLLAWLCLEISDRRGNWIWLAPMIIGCCLGLHWLVLAIYLLVGRRAT